MQFMSARDIVEAGTPLVGLTRDELAALVERLGERRFRAGQLYTSVYRRRVLDAREMTDLPKAFRERVAEEHGVTATTVGGP